MIVPDVTTLESPPGFVVRTELEQAAFENGFRLPAGAEGGWLGWRSNTANGVLWLAGAGALGPWLVSTDHPGVAGRLGARLVAGALLAPGLAVWRADDKSALHGLVARIYALAASLPDAPLQEFQRLTANLPDRTEAERLTRVRIGQDVFRRALVQFWSGACAVTGIDDAALLRASHIVPWAECETDAQRLDVNNGLLLSALWDAAFDAGLLGFDGGGAVVPAPDLSQAARKLLPRDGRLRIPPSESQRVALRAHRRRNGLESEDG